MIIKIMLVIDDKDDDDLPCLDTTKAVFIITQPSSHISLPFLFTSLFSNSIMFIPGGGIFFNTDEGGLQDKQLHQATSYKEQQPELDTSGANCENLGVLE